MMDRAPPAGTAEVAARARRLRLRPALAARGPVVHAAAVVTFLASAAVAWLAQQSGFPITAAISFLLGVTLVGALEGVRGGVAAALAASVVYNFVLIEPAFRFSLATLDDYVPLAAFNLAAAASGFLAGRLKDRALAAELATHRVEALLVLSRTLQAAVDLADVTAAVETFAAAQGFGSELYIGDSGVLEPQRPQPRRSNAARRLLEAGGSVERQSRYGAFVLASADTRLGVLVVEWDERQPTTRQWEDLVALASLVSITVERCLLLDRVARAELVRKSEEFKTALLSSVSHDLRTPLTAIAASASGLARYGDALPEGAKADMLNMIQEQCQRLNRYTAKLLSLGRLQAGLDSDRFTDCDAIEALGSAISQARELASRHSFARVVVPSEAIVRADPVMLEQVFYNVLENAVRYSAAGSPITIHAATRDGWLGVSVRDEGVGIPPADLERVFDRFYRVGDRQSVGSTGLGLAIARGFTEAFGGRIRAQRAEDPAGGTVVTIELPVAADEAAA